MCKSKTSVIIPAYNSEKTIAKCLKSILKQTYQDLEIIIVNDGSEDNTLAVLQTLALIDKRIRILDQMNQGVEMARKNGYEIATGKWIAFVDHDDWLPNNAIELLINTAEIKKADCVIGRHIRVLDGHGWIKKSISDFPLAIDIDLFNHREFNHLEFMNELYISFFGVNILPVSMWGRIYKKSLIDKASIEYKNLKRSDDLSFNIQCLPFANRIATIPDVIYYWRYGGASNQLHLDTMEEAITLYHLKKVMIEKYNFKKALQPIAIELNNWLMGFIKSLIIHEYGGKEEIVSIIKNEMKRPEMREAIFIPTWDKFTSDDLVSCMKNMDADKYYFIIERSTNKEKIKRQILSLMSKMLR